MNKKQKKLVRNEELPGVGRREDPGLGEFCARSHGGSLRQGRLGDAGLHGPQVPRVVQDRAVVH